MTNEDQEATIQALLHERRGYEVHGDKDGVRQVDEQLKRLGHEAEKPQQRASKRPAQRKGRSTR